MKCEICKKKIEKTFLSKFNGAYIRDKKGKLHVVCSECQRRFRSREELLSQL